MELAEMKEAGPCDSDNSLSMTTPRSRTRSDGCIQVSERSRGTVLRRRREQSNQISSVLTGLSRRWLLAIQLWTPLMMVVRFVVSARAACA